MVGGVSNVAYYLSQALASRTNVAYFPLFTPKINYLLNLFSVYKKFGMNEFDIIHFNFVPIWINGSSMLLKFAKVKGVSTVLNIHGILPLEEKLDAVLKSTSLMALSNTVTSCKIADRVVVNSKHMLTKVVTWYSINPDKIVVIPNGLDLRRFTACDDRVMLEGDPVILYVGHLSMMKGIDILIRAVSKIRSELPNMRLHLVGSAVPLNRMSEFQLLAKKEGVENSVVFHGWVANSMVPRYYKSADLCVFPSRIEGFGIVILEAMSSGVPIIASDIAAFREIITSGKNGILFKAGSSDSLSKAILALSQDSGLKRVISQAASKTVMKYSWENIADMYVSLYKSLRQ